MSARKKERGKRRAHGEAGTVHRVDVPVGAEALAIHELAALAIDARTDAPGRLRFSTDAAGLARILVAARIPTALLTRLARGNEATLAAGIETFLETDEVPEAMTLAVDETAEGLRTLIPPELRASSDTDPSAIGVLRLESGRRGESVLFLDRLLDRGERGSPGVAAALVALERGDGTVGAVLPAGDVGCAREAWVRWTGSVRGAMAVAPGARARSIAAALAEGSAVVPRGDRSEELPIIFDDDPLVRERAREWGGGVAVREVREFAAFAARRDAADREDSSIVLHRVGGNAASVAAVAAHLRASRAISHGVLADDATAIDRLFPAGVPAGGKSFAFADGDTTCTLVVLPPARDIVATGPDQDSGSARAPTTVPAVDDPTTAEFIAILTENARLRRRWPERHGTDAYRLYDRELEAIPLAVDRYGSALHITVYPATAGADREREERWVAAAGTALGFDPSRVFVKRKERRAAGEQHGVRSRAGVRTEVREAGLRYEVNLSDYVDTGLFLDHRDTRTRVRAMVAGKRFLNLFCYTGAFTVVAAAGGATGTVSIDTSATYLRWARENLRRNDLDGPQHRFVRGDALAEVRALPAGVRFDLAFIDPPTRSNRHGSELEWDVQRDHVALIEAVGERLAPGGAIIFSTNFRRFRLDGRALVRWEIEEWTPGSIPPDIGDRKVHRCWHLRARG